MCLKRSKWSSTWSPAQEGKEEEESARGKLEGRWFKKTTVCVRFLMQDGAWF